MEPSSEGATFRSEVFVTALSTPSGFTETVALAVGVASGSSASAVAPVQAFLASS